MLDYLTIIVVDCINVLDFGRIDFEMLNMIEICRYWCKLTRVICLHSFKSQFCKFSVMLIFLYLFFVNWFFFSCLYISFLRD